MGKLRDIGTPIFWAEGHPGSLSARGWRVELGGLVAKPVTLTYDEILALPKSVADARLTSVSGFSVRGRWGGVRLSDLLTVTGAAPTATHIRFVSYPGVYTTCIPLSVGLRQRTMLAYEFDEESLDADYGGPVRVFCPYLWGYKSAKSVIAMTLENRSIPGYWEVRGYPDEALIKSRWLLDVNSQRQRRIPDGEVVSFVET